MSKMDLAKSIARSVGSASIASMAQSTPAPARSIEDVTREILDAKGQVVEGYLTIGTRLIEAKEMLDHGEWLPWLAERVDISERNAQNYMRVAREYANPQALAGLGFTKALALLALPSGEREEFIEGHAVADMSTRELEQAIRERDEARKAAEDAEKQTQMLRESADRENARANAAEARVHELESAPRDVYRDEAAIEAARKEAEDKWRAKLEKLEKKLREAEEKAKTDGAADETAQLRTELENARRQLAMSDAAVTAFRLRFEAWQQAYSAVKAALDAVAPETAKNLRAAVAKQVANWGKEFGHD